MKAGLISPLWLPRYGGGEQYNHRLALALAERGVDMHVFCGTAEDPDKDNGTFPATRWTPYGSLEKCDWHIAQTNKTASINTRKFFKHLLKKKSSNMYERLSKRSMLASIQYWPDKSVFIHHDFMDAALTWARDLELNIALIGSPLAEVSQLQARELYLQLRACGIKVGAIQHDLGHSVHHDLVNEYIRNDRNWDVAANKVTETIDGLLKQNPRQGVYYRINSPLLFSPDFVISCSNWSSRFIDPADAVSKIVLHPLMNANYWQRPAENPEGLPPCDILMINPQSRKNPTLMADLIAKSDPGWTFRVMKGGWGNAFGEFMPMVKRSRAAREQRIDFRSYAQDMREVYHNTKVLFFPSYAEGYGMTAVEPMFSGTPVVSSNYPAILEAVGDGAYTLCPYTDSTEKWHHAVREVLNNPDYWREQSLMQASRISERENKELENLIGFFKSLL